MKDSNRIHREPGPESAEHERFWDRVNAAFDERRDPLDDVDVQRLVAERPEWLGELQRTRDAIAGMPKVPHASSARARSTSRDVASTVSPSNTSKAPNAANASNTASAASAANTASRATQLAAARSASRIAWPVAAAVAFVIVPVQFLLRSAHDGSPGRSASASTASAGCVHSFRAEVIDEDAYGRSTTRFDGERIVRTRETFAAPSMLGDTGAADFVAVVQSSYVPIRSHASDPSADSTSDRSTTR